MAEQSNDNKDITAPQKKYFRQRAHSNPLADHSFLYPVKPETMNWNPFYPNFFDKDGVPLDSSHQVSIVDVGCGYGGLLVSLAPLFPNSLILGMEIRVKVSAYVHQRILALREQSKHENYENIAVVRTNAMKYITNFFKKGQLEKMFFLYPDPHFKKSKNKWRIISETLLSEYAFLLKVGGIVYTITDVEELHLWIKNHFNQHPLFQELSPQEYQDDPVVEKLSESTEEGKKVTRNQGSKFMAIFIRIQDPYDS